MTESPKFLTKPPLTFSVDGEDFQVIAAVPAEELAQLLDLQSGLSGEGIGLAEQYQGIKNLFQFTMVPESWERFSGRLGDRSRPIDFTLLMEITKWLTAEWSGRPLLEPSSSTASPGPDGTTTTDGAPVDPSTLTEPATVEISVVPDTSIESGIG